MNLLGLTQRIRMTAPAPIGALAALVMFIVNTAAPSLAQDAALQNAAAAAPPAIYVTSVTAGYVDPAHKVPTINGVPGALATNVDVAIPLALLTHGNIYVYSLTVQDNTFTGSCTASYSLTQVQGTKTVTLDTRAITTFKTAPGNVWLWVSQGKPIPNSPGPATLTGSVKCGTSTYSKSSAVLLQ